MFAHEGYVLIGGSLAAGLALVLLGTWAGGFWQVALLLLAVLMVAFTLYFFRDPERVPPEEARDGRLLLAPADGKVVEIADEEEPHYLKGPARRVSIFLSPLNVHVNRVPADGTIEFVRYLPGDYLVAWHPKASEKNERSELGLQHPSGIRIFFKQIAGAMARRIVYHLKEGDEVKAGDRFGIVKFGSRMDVLVPPGIDIKAEVGQRVTAGQTILARLPASPTQQERSETEARAASR